ncbi:MAG TPA: class I SAM-dependent methyltransferase [Candidatus Nanoarchaeia archaeon]|nr:class I SAM-dependent methyltransferase [Candidatus Nanoarchaeia archaeon]
MQEKYEEEYVKQEKKNAWFVERKNLVYSLLKNVRKDASILEIGCGSGYILDHLQKNGFKKVSGVDSSKGFLKYYKNISKSTKLVVKKNAYDVILLLDVIEHVKKEDEILRKIQTMLKSQGTLLISAPAYQFLWSHHDELNQHYRRYTKGMLRKALARNNFSIERMTYWNSIMLLPIFIIKKLQNIRKSKASNMETMPTWSNGIYKLLLKIENTVVRTGINLPFGVSVFAIAKKNQR